MTNYLNRSLEPVLQRAVTEFPAVVLTGPRQSGKTTLLKHLFGSDYGYLSLELPDVRAAAEEDPRSFMARFPPPVIYDEVQFVPGLLPYIKERIDEDRSRAGQFLLSGSQNLLLNERITESLPGRAAILHLLPMSGREACGNVHAPLVWEADHGTGTGLPLPPRTFWSQILRGGYPELVAGPRRDLQLWHSSYIQTYLERDVRSLRQIGDLGRFRSFLRAIAARTGQLLNLSDISRDLGVAVNTAKAWLSILEATYQVFIVRPYFVSLGKRLVKSPKVYFANLGTLCHLTGLKDPDHAAAGPLAGPLMEAAVLGEIVKTLTHRGERPEVYFWRTAAGAEVDFVVEANGTIIPIEAKTTATPRPRMVRGIKTLRKELGKRCGPGFLIHTGDERLPMGSEVMAVGFSEL